MTVEGEVPDLRAWAGLRVLRRLDEGHRNVVVEVGGCGAGRLVARRSVRDVAALDWELDLLAFLDGHGFAVPRLVPTDDGRRHDAGVVVQSWVDGGPPDRADAPRVAAALRRLHALTVGWPQRPGFRSSRDLLTATRGGDVDLTVMPPDVVADCRRAWRLLAPRPGSVVHGDPGRGNVRVTAGRVGLIDWDEARVDHPDLDLGDLPGALPPDRAPTAAAAAHAWEAATCWTAEPDYARTRLSGLRACLASTAPPSDHR